MEKVFDRKLKAYEHVEKVWKDSPKDKLVEGEILVVLVKMVKQELLQGCFTDDLE